MTLDRLISDASVSRQLLHALDGSVVGPQRLSVTTASGKVVRLVATQLRRAPGGLLVKTAALLLLLSATAQADVLWVKFAPEDDCTAAIVAEFDRAKSSLAYTMYNCTSPEIGDALIRAHKRGVKVTMLLDPDEAKKPYSQSARCKAAGIKVYVDRCKPVHPICHTKWSVIDERLLLTGSFNHSRQAAKNSEDLQLQDNRDDGAPIVKAYLASFARHLKHAEAY